MLPSPPRPCPRAHPQAFDIAALKVKGPNAPTNFDKSRYADVMATMGDVTLEEFIVTLRRQSQVRRPHPRVLLHHTHTRAPRRAAACVRQGVGGVGLGAAISPRC